MASASIPLLWEHNEMAPASLPPSEHTMKWCLPHYLSLSTQWNGVCLTTSVWAHTEMASASLHLSEHTMKWCLPQYLCFENTQWNGICLTTPVFWTHNEMVSASLPLLSEHKEMVPASLPLTVWMHKRFKLSGFRWVSHQHPHYRGPHANDKLLWKCRNCPNAFISTPQMLVLLTQNRAKVCFCFTFELFRPCVLDKQQIKASSLVTGF